MSQDVLRLEQRVTHAEEVESNKGPETIGRKDGSSTEGDVKKGLNLKKTDSLLPKKSKSRLKVHKMDLRRKN